MKIAFTGSSSTGKTTLARQLMENEQFVGVVGEFVTEDARSLLQSLGHSSMDNMSRDELRRFQLRYLEQKLANETNRRKFLVDRSYVDVAAYWLVRDSFDLPIERQESFANRCRELAGSYDLHVHFPFGVIPFASDGFRSESVDFHRRIADKIHELLNSWGISFISIESNDLPQRMQQVVSRVAELARDRS